MTAKRFLAFLGALALIVGAVFLRNYLDDRSSSSTSDSTVTPAGGTVTVICSTEFEAVCNRLDPTQFDVTIQSAGRTLDDLSAASAKPPDAWITLDPFPGMVDETRTFAGLSVVTPHVVAVATDVAKIAVAAGQRAVAFAAGCAGQPAWRCIGTSAGEPWATLDPAAGSGAILPGYSDPDQEALGLVTFANAVGGYFDNAGFASSDWLGNADFNGWLRNLKNHDSIQATGGSALSTLVLRPTLVNVAATTGVELRANPQPAAVVAVDLTPAVAVVAVVAAFTPKGDRLAAAITPALITAGWSRATDTKPQLPAGTFVALRKLWEGKS